MKKLFKREEERLPPNKPSMATEADGGGGCTVFEDGSVLLTGYCARTYFTAIQGGLTVGYIERNGNYFLTAKDNDSPWSLLINQPEIIGAVLMTSALNDGGADDPSLILGLRGVDWGSSTKNIGAWLSEADSNLKYGKLGSKRRGTGQAPGFVKVIISPIVALPNAFTTVTTGTNLYGEEVSTAQRIYAPVSAMMFLFPAQVSYFLAIPEETLYIIDPLINESSKK